jgi:rod shape-determining protein MreB
MLSAVLGLFSQDLAVDLGTSSTRIYQRGVGVVCREPTLVAVHTDRRGRRRVMAVGEEARPMEGRTPPDTEAVRPVRDGQIHDYEVAEALLQHLVRRIHGRNAWVSPKMVITIPHCATDMERRALRESCETAGARDVHLVPRPLAAALGAELPVERPSGHMVVDLGGGATEVSVLSMAGVVASRTIPGGGRGMDRALIDFLRGEHRLLVGAPTAEGLKEEVATAMPPTRPKVRRVSGRCLRRGVPRSAEVSAEEAYRAIRGHVEAIGTAIRAVLDQSPPELATDIVDHGVVLTGGGSQLTALPAALREVTGLAVVRAERPASAVVLGAGRILEEMDLLRAVAC